MVLMKAIDQQSDWQNEHQKLTPVSVNVSFDSLQSKELIEELRELGHRAKHVTLELLESIDLDDHDAELSTALDDLRRTGVGIEIDDFGAGRTSILAGLKVQPDCLKIDKRLIDPIAADNGALNVVKSIIGIGQTLGIEAVRRASKRKSKSESALILAVIAFKDSISENRNLLPILKGHSLKLLEKTPKARSPLDQSGNVRERIANATKQSREALHSHPILCRLTAVDLGQEEYTNILQRHLAFFEVAERLRKWFKIASALSFQQELRLLREDLYGYGEPRPQQCLTFETRCQVLGMVYVLLGSRFGARIIGKSLKAALPTHDHRFFNETKLRDRWCLLLSELEAEGANSQQFAEMLNGAETTFLAFGKVMLAVNTRHDGR